MLALRYYTGIITGYYKEVLIMLTHNETVNQYRKRLGEKVEHVTGDDRKTGKDLIAFFHDSPLAEVAAQFERDKSTSCTVTF